MKYMFFGPVHVTREREGGGNVRIYWYPAGGIGHISPAMEFRQTHSLIDYFLRRIYLLIVKYYIWSPLYRWKKNSYVFRVFKYFGIFYSVFPIQHSDNKIHSEE